MGLKGLTSSSAHIPCCIHYWIASLLDGYIEWELVGNSTCSSCIFNNSCSHRIQLPQYLASPEPTTLDSGVTGSTPVCPSARGEGAVSPAVSIYSITFVVNGLEHVVRAGDKLDTFPGDEVEVRQITICTESFSGNSGEVCVDFAPVDQNGQEIISEHQGTHMIQMVSGFATISGPSHTWTVGENWRKISAVLNHWPVEDTEDLDCGNRRCEHDDRIVIDLR